METYGLEKLGIINTRAVYRNLTPAQLVEHALARGEGTLSNTGALVVKTGKYTGRSANDKFIVDTPAVHDDIAWGKVNRPIEKAKFDAIRAKVIAYLQGKDVFIFDGFAGARSQVYEGVPHRQRAGEPEPLHPPAAAPPDGRAARGLPRGLYHHRRPRLQVHPRDRRDALRGRDPRRL